MKRLSYKFTVPPTWNMGSHTGICRGSATETYRANALWEYNQSRAREGFGKLERMPAGTTYIPLYEYDILMHTSEGWEVVSCEASWKDAKRAVQEYRDNQPGQYKIKRVKA